MNFKKGQKVLCVDGNSKLHPVAVKKGGEYIIDGFSCCADCGMQTVTLVGLSELSEVYCKCGSISEERENYRASRFIPADNTAQQDLLKESISEVKELQEQKILIQN